MPIYVGTNKIKNIYHGTTKIKKVYSGTTLVWQDSSIVYSGTTTSLATARFSHEGASVGNYALFAGGRNGGGTTFYTVETYSNTLVRGTATALYASYPSSLKSTQTPTHAFFAEDSTSSGFLSTYNTSLVQTVASAVASTENKVVGSVGQYAIYAGGHIRSKSRTQTSGYSYNSTLVRANYSLGAIEGSIVGNVGGYMIYGGGGMYDGEENYNYSAAYSINTSLVRSTIGGLSTVRQHFGNSHSGAGTNTHALLGGRSNVVDAYNTSLVRTTATVRATTATSEAIGKENFVIFAGANGIDSSATSTVSIYNETLTRTTATISVARDSCPGARVGNYIIFAGGANGLTQYANADYFTVT